MMSYWMCNEIKYSVSFLVEGS